MGSKKSKTEKYFYFLKQKNHDSIFLQETHSRFNDEKFGNVSGKVIFFFCISKIIVKELRCFRKTLIKN